jgi:cell wall-associated NlpC family hydrolase
VVSITELQSVFDADQKAGRSTEYQCQANLNLYDSPALTSLATQAVAGRQLRVAAVNYDRRVDSIIDSGHALLVKLCEDGYPGWLPLEDLDLIEVAEAPYQAIAFSTAEIAARTPQVIAFTHQAKAQPNQYLWGGTVGPNYDCSGLIQTAFAASGIWLPRDAYQQEGFVQSIVLVDQPFSLPHLSTIRPGDLIFFGSPIKTTHVGLYLGDGYYIHSSGKDQGRNGMGIDCLSNHGDRVSQAYLKEFRGVGRVVACYQPTH